MSMNYQDASLVVNLSSAIKHGSIYNRDNAADSEVIAARHAWLEPLDIRVDHTIRLAVNYEKDDFCQYVQVGEGERGRGMLQNDAVIADALVATASGVALFLPVSDCIAAVFYDKKRGVLMLSHLGRHSLEQQGAATSVRYLAEYFGSNPVGIQVWTSPAIDKERYPIFKLNGQGMKEAFFEQLAAAGILSSNIHDDPRSTADSDDLYSYSETLRGDTHIGSHGVVAMMR